MIEVLKQALDALEAHADIGIRSDKAISSLKKAIAELEKQEPVGKFIESPHGNYPALVWARGYVAKIGDKLYTSPQPRKPLTEEEIEDIAHDCDNSKKPWCDIVFARAIEKAHGIGEAS
jgi:hypothetical protein